jgi:hypothetical protein
LGMAILGMCMFFTALSSANVVNVVFIVGYLDW